MSLPRHPAKFNDDLLRVIQEFVPPEEYPDVLDPFAGTGRIHELENWTLGIEIEPEWAAYHHYTIVGDATDLPAELDTFDAVVTSPCYGNRMADHHEAKDASRRNTYRHALGRPLSPGSAGGLQWGDEYRELHTKAWQEAYRVLRPGGRIIVNIKDHIRKGRQVPVSQWHYDTLVSIGFRPYECAQVECPGLRHGANHKLRVEYEWLLVMDKP